MGPLTRSCFLLLVLGRLFLLARSFLLGISPRSRWSPPLPLHALGLITFSLAKVRLSPILTLFPTHDLILWTDGSDPFPFVKGASVVLANCSLRSTETTLSFSAGPVCSSFSAEACAILHALCWSRQHQQVCHFSSLFLLPYSRSVLATLSSPPSFLLSQTLWQICLLSPPALSGYNGSPDTHFYWGTTRLTSLPDGVRCLRLPQSLVVSLLLSLVSTLVFSRTVSSKFFNTQVPSIFTEDLVLPRHARCVLSRLSCNGHNLLLASYLSRIGRIENPSCSACGHSSQDTSHLILHCPATDSLGRSLLATLCLVTTSGPDPGELPGFLCSMVFRHALIPRKGSGNQQQHLCFLIGPRSLLYKAFLRSLLTYASFGWFPFLRATNFNKGNQRCGSGSWKRFFFCGSGREIAKIPPLPHRREE